MLNRYFSVKPLVFFYRKYINKIRQFCCRYLEFWQHSLFSFEPRIDLLEKERDQNKHGFILSSFIAITCLLLAGCGEVTTGNFASVVVNLSHSYPALWKLTTGVAYLFGVAFIMRGVWGLKVYGDMRTMMSSGSNIKGPLILLLVGSALMFFPTTKSVFLESTFGVGQQSPLSYSTVQGMGTETFQALLGFVQLVGLISFIRGWIILAHSASPSSQSQFPKAVTHIIAGLLGINIQGTIDMINSTLF